MAFTAAVGRGQAPGGLAAGRQAAEGVRSSGQGFTPDLLLLFASSKYVQAETIQGVRQVFPRTPLLGCSTAGEIYQDEPQDRSVVLAAMAGVRAVLDQGGDIGENSDQAGRILGRKLAGSRSRAYLIFSDGLVGNDAALLRGLQKELGETAPLIGGAAGDDFVFQKTYQYLQDQVLSGALVGAGLHGDFTFGVGVRHGWEAVGRPVHVTQSCAQRLQELNHQPAIRLYEEYFGEFAQRLHTEPLARLAVSYPLGMAIPDSSEFLLRAPFSFQKDGSILCKAEIPEGSEVRLMIGSTERAIAAARIAAMEALSQMQGRPPQLVLVFNCVARRKVLGRRAADEIKTVRDILGPRVPTAGFYTYGEIAPLEGNTANPSFFHNETVVILTLG